ncbi:MAG TPA: class I SAM-dependent methyltransferase, partial [Actinobacteria bacterium]|nr:class I SAM-dependent methyltransferase [Actinomycetes bacterium]HEX21510.1 class I SAM-dependent methyltransferase [Actinomycetota bacterium]
DHDLVATLAKMKLTGGNFLDLGAGPGTQAIALARRGFKVTAVDISPTAVEKAKQRAGREGVSVDFRQDDIIKTKLNSGYDYIFDRGCFHVLAPENRADYVMAIRKLLRKGGFLFLKTFSYKQEGKEDPYRFHPSDIRKFFGPWLKVVSIKESYFESTLESNPKALFCVLENSKL